jgi:tyrosinase
MTTFRAWNAFGTALALDYDSALAKLLHVPTVPEILDRRTTVEANVVEKSREVSGGLPPILAAAASVPATDIEQAIPTWSERPSRIDDAPQQAAVYRGTRFNAPGATFDSRPPRSNSMPQPSRRAFLGSAASVPLALWLGRFAQAHTAGAYVRYDARSPDGQAMLSKYATAVAKMKARPENDPLSWLFQWYTHAVPDPGKPQELTRIFPNGMPAAPFALANDAWDTCQPHNPPGTEDFFLPWHRLFVRYLEEIVRAVLADQTFTLPYWDYTAADATLNGVLPVEFRKANDATFGPLYVSNRSPGVNDGQPIQGQGGPPLNLSDLTATPYGGAVGFCGTLDGDLHGAVHVLVGDTQNMGAVPYAARDPIFWLHHCNIDRLWASWNAAGNPNPALNRTFTFAKSDGTSVVANLGDVMDLATMDYKYDRLENVPSATAGAAPPASLGPTPKPIASTSAPNQGPTPPIALGATPVTISLTMRPPAAGAAPLLFGKVATGLAPSAKLTLLFQDLRAQAAPGVVYKVYVGLPDNPTPEQLKEHYVGMLNFFNAVSHGGHAPQGMPAPSGSSAPIAITGVAKDLATKGRLANNPKVTLIPSGTPSPNAKATIGGVTLYQH